MKEGWYILELAQLPLHQEYEAQRWLQQLENGMMVVLMERLEKLEARMAKKDKEIALLQGQVGPYLWAIC